MRNLNWRVELAGLFTLVLGASLLFQLFYVLPYIRNREVKMSKAHQEEITRNIAWKLDIDLRKAENKLTRIAQLEQFRNMDIVNQHRAMTQTVETSERFSSLFVMDAKGWFVSGTVENFPVYTTKSFADRPYFAVPFRLY